MLTYDKFIEMFSSFEHNTPILGVSTTDYCIDNGIQLSQHKLLSVKYYQRIYISLWLDGTDARTNEFLDQHGSIIRDMKIDDNIKRFIKFRYQDMRYGVCFVFNWLGGDAEFEIIGNTHWSNSNYYDVPMSRFANNDYHVENVVLRFLDVIINKNPEYFKNKYKLK